MNSSLLAAIMSFGGVVITAALATLTAIRAGKDRAERNASRRQIEEETTEVILKRTRRELDRVYTKLDVQADTIRQFHAWITRNTAKFNECGIHVPDFDVDEGSLVELAREMRPQIDQEIRDAWDEQRAWDEEKT